MPWIPLNRHQLRLIDQRRYCTLSEATLGKLGSNHAEIATPIYAMPLREPNAFLDLAQRQVYIGHHILKRNIRADIEVMKENRKVPKPLTALW